MSVPSAALPTRSVVVHLDGPVRARLAAPGSKSHTNRVVACAALAEGTSTLAGPLDSDDSQAMRAVAGGLGAHVGDADPRRWTVAGVAGRPAGGAHVDCRLSGTALRFGTAMAALGERASTLDGLEPLRRRPVGALSAALRHLGAEATDRDGHPPVRAGGGLDGGTVEVDAASSSQFVSAVLLAAPCARAPVTVIPRRLAARAYVDLTVAAMRDFTADVTECDDGWAVRPGGYRATHVTVEHDASAAAHLLALAAATGGTVTVANAAATVQPDAAVPDLLAAMGCDVRRDGDAVTVAGPERLQPLDADLSALPDQITTMASLAALADGTSRLTGVAVARGHETDRLAALARELGKLGVDVAEQPDGLVVHGGHARGPAVLATHDDHRLAMAFAAVAARLDGVAVAEPWCVAKTYPRFWTDLAAAGATVVEVGEEDR